MPYPHEEIPRARKWRVKLKRLEKQVDDPSEIELMSGIEEGPSAELGIIRRLGEVEIGQAGKSQAGVGPSSSSAHQALKLPNVGTLHEVQHP